MGEVKITLIDDTNELLSTKYSAALKFIFHGNAIQAMLYSYMVGCYQWYIYLPHIPHSFFRVTSETP